MTDVMIANASTVIDGPWNSRYRQMVSTSPWTQGKHNHYADFDWPGTVDFPLAYQAYRRNGLAKAAINKTIDKTWQTQPFLLEKPRDGTDGKKRDETPLELEIRLKFGKLRAWQRLMEADRRSMVGRYAGVIMRIADSQPFSAPLVRAAGLDALKGLIPAWEGQLTVAEWGSDPTADDYGEPTMYQFNEANMEGTTPGARQFLVHPSRVILWSEDGTVRGTSSLEAGYNALSTLEKVSGAGGEGFWKNAKSAPVLTIDPLARLDQMAKAMGTTVEKMADLMDEQVEGWQRGFDRSLLLQGMKAETLGIVLPSPEHFYNIALQEFAASYSMPLKILVGSQSGERASTEDASEWAQTNMSRRDNETIPNIMLMVDRFVEIGVLPAKDWTIDWADLTEANMEQKIDRAVKMADVDTKLQGSGEWVFRPEEIRSTVGLEPLSDAEKYREDTTEDDEDAALGGDPKQPGNTKQEPKA